MASRLIPRLESRRPAPPRSVLSASANFRKADEAAAAAAATPAPAASSKVPRSRKRKQH